MNGRNIIKLNDTHQKSKNGFYKMIISIQVDNTTK